MTSPAVSNALSRLRLLLNDALFVRRGRGLVPTPRALELQPMLRAIFASLEAGLSSREAFDPKTCTRTLTLALSDADQVASLSALRREFSRRLPRAQLRIVSLDTLVASGGLSGELVDAVIGPPSAEPGVHHQPAYDDRAVDTRTSERSSDWKSRHPSYSSHDRGGIPTRGPPQATRSRNATRSNAESRVGVDGCGSRLNTMPSPGR